ncbi:unnamed protein product [Cunninghamella blakesleeana]
MNISELCLTSDTTYPSTTVADTYHITVFITTTTTTTTTLHSFHSTLPRFSDISTTTNNNVENNTNNYKYNNNTNTNTNTNNNNNNNNNHINNNNNSNNTVITSSTLSPPSSTLTLPPFTSYHASPIEQTNSFSKLTSSLPQTPPLTEGREDDNNSNNNSNTNKHVEINKLVEKCDMLCKDLNRYKAWKKGSDEDREVIFDFVSHTAQEIFESLILMQQQEEDNKYDSPMQSNNSNSEMEYEMIRQARNWKDNRKPKYRRRNKRSMVGQRCHSCHTTETPEWRRGPDGARTLCNACGLHYSKLLRKESLSVSLHKSLTSGANNTSSLTTSQSMSVPATSILHHTTILTTTSTPSPSISSGMPSSFPFMMSTSNHLPLHQSFHQQQQQQHHLSPHPTPPNLVHSSPSTSSPSSTSSNFSIVHQHHTNFN